MRKIHKYKFYEWMVALCVFFNGLGFVLSIAGINIVNIFTLIAVAAIAVDVIRKNSLKQLFHGKKKRFFLLFFLVWGLYALFQTAFVDISREEYDIVFRQLITNAVFVYFVGYTVCSEESFKLIEKAMIGVLAVNLGMGMFEVLTGVHFAEADSIWDAGSTRAFSSNPNEYATTVYCTLMCLAFSSFKRRIGWREILFTASAFICVFSSHCRGILLALIVFVFLYMGMQFYYFTKGKAALAKGIVAGVLILFGFLAVQGVLLEILQWFVENFSGKGDYESDLYRLSLINTGLDYYKETGGFGVGAGQSIYLVKTNLHNFFIEILVEYGVFIFAGVLMILWEIWKRAFDTAFSRKIRCIYFALMPSLILASMVSSSINKFKIFWVMIFLFYLSGEYLGEQEKGR